MKAEDGKRETDDSNTKQPNYSASKGERRIECTRAPKAAADAIPRRPRARAGMRLATKISDPLPGLAGVAAPFTYPEEESSHASTVSGLARTAERRHFGFQLRAG